MMLCPSCGQQTADERDFCTNCDAYLRWDEPEPRREPERAPTVAMAPAPEETPTTVMEVEPPPAPDPAEEVKVSLLCPDDTGAGAPASVRVQAGGRAQLMGIVFNQSGIVDGYDLRIAGIDATWSTVVPSTVHLVPFGAPDGTPEQRVEIHLHPPRTSQATARAWEIALVARSRSRGTDSASANGTVTIEPYAQIDCRVSPQTVRDRRSGHFAIPVRNLGNAPAHVHFLGEDDEDMLRFEFEPPSLTLSPGQEARARLTVSARQDVRDGPRDRRLTIAVEGAGDRSERHVRFIQEPIVVRSYRHAWRVALTLVSALLLISAAFLSWDGDGDQGVCTDGDTGCLSYNHFVEQAGYDTPPVPDVGSFQGLFAAATSIGILAVLLGLLVLVGARRGTGTWLAGVLAILLAVAMFATIGTAGVGVWLLLLAGAAAVVAGVLAP